MNKFLGLALIAASCSPLVLTAATIPQVPTFKEVPIVSEDGSYRIAWHSAGSGVRYVVQGEGNGTLYNGYGTFFSRSSLPSGTYAYKIKACADGNSWTCSQYSQKVSVDVEIDPVIPGINDDNSAVEWTTLDFCYDYPCLKSRIFKGRDGEGKGLGQNNSYWSTRKYLYILT